MPRNNNLSLSGNGDQNLHKLDIQSNNRMRDPTQIKKLKIIIMNTLIIPFISKNWKVLEENLVFLDLIQTKIKTYSAKYPKSDIQIYGNLLDAFKTSIFLQMEITSLEEKLYGNNCNMGSLLFKTTMIRLKPELELYNLIIGPPKLKFGETYNTDITHDIETLLKVNNITFEQIKTYIVKKYLDINQII